MARQYTRLICRDEEAFSSAHVREMARPGKAVARHVGDLIREGQRAGRLPPANPEHLRLLLMATSVGLAALVTTGTVEAAQVDGLIADAVALFTRGPH